MIKKKLKSLLERFPYIRTLAKKLQRYQSDSWVPPGHFYSPVINWNEILKRRDKIFLPATIECYGIDLNVEGQLQLLKVFSMFTDISFPAKSAPEFRYYFENKFFTYSDGFYLNAMVRYFMPKKVLEIGSGYSSALLLDINQFHFDNLIDLTFIEPYPENRLNKLIRTNDKAIIIEQFVQDLDLDKFKQLKKNDILFIDSSHVVKTGSELNFLIFEVFPLLNSGVIIHFHDIFYPFEYPIEWLEEKRSWNENYFLRAFLMHNPDFKILIFNSFIEKFFSKDMEKISPILLKEKGSSLWIQKIV